MGVQPQVVPLRLSHVETPSSKPRVSSPSGKPSSRWHRHQPEESEAVVLPAEAQQLKEKVLASHKHKYVRFSLSQMRKVATAPVSIPKELDNPRAVSSTVAGKSVAMTKTMWRNGKKRVKYMPRIEEYWPLTNMRIR